MPIKPENKGRYPANWDEIRESTLERAGHQCECRGECGSEHAGGWCRAPNGRVIQRPIHTPHLWYWSGESRYAKPVKVVLTIAHLDHTPENNDPSNLRALCQLCHLRHDREHHAETRAQTRLSRQPGLPFEEVES